MWGCRLSANTPDQDGFEARAKLAGAYTAAFGSAEGQMVLRDLLAAGGVLAVAHVSGDSHETAFNDGRRSIALHLLNHLRWSEAELLRLARARTHETIMATEVAE